MEQTFPNFNIKEMTLFVMMDGSHQIGMFSLYERNEILDGPVNVGYSYIFHPDESKAVSVFYAENYRTDKIQTPSQKENQITFWRNYKKIFNLKASRIANIWDKNYKNCIVGNCAFVFINENIMMFVIL